ncbi:MAG: Coenzyme F420 hydrogenase/dehydrogenase, beta subunit C-terminal domain [Bacteroidales bacterium]|nr:Coenzyme F420 hydrogenase/dehydrogenase, beta subunit C-terminal domain [Candidatus Cryptobacteroides onthequi]
MKLADKYSCVGCGACAQKCPKGCISMMADHADGFLYPAIDKESCIDCGACAKVCPTFDRHEETSANYAYAYQNNNELVLRCSSSGGLFSALATDTIKNGGVVFGARFDANWQVAIDYTETIDGISDFRGSKYVQAKIGNSYNVVKSFLDSGRRVLFSGTPCQVVGLKSFLNKDYNLLLTIDVICHGVPSPMVWQKYLEEQKEPVRVVRFRDKASGWKRYGTTIGEQSGPYWENTYMKAFLGNIDLRLSCSTCMFKAGKSGSDMTIGDFWGIDKIKPEIDNDRGLCCVIFNSKKGEGVCSHLGLMGPFSIDLVRQHNPSYNSPSAHNINRSYFFDRLQSDSFSRSYEKTLSSSVLRRIERKLFRALKK